MRGLTIEALLGRSHPVGRVIAEYQARTWGLGAPDELWPELQVAGTALRAIGRAARAAGDQLSAGAADRQALALEIDTLEIASVYRAFLGRSPALARGWALTPWDDPRLPHWHGERLSSDVLLTSPGGLGDWLMFARWLPSIAARVAGVVPTVRAPLARLARGLPGVSSVQLIGGPPSVGSATRCASPALGMWLAGSSGRTLPPAPYLRPDPALVARWRPVLSRAGAGLRVGLVWASGAVAARDRGAARSIGLAALAPLGAVPGVGFFGLQKTTPDWAAAAGGHPAEAEPAPAGLDPVRLGPAFADLADTAAVMCLLDLVISVDSAPAHLAGALGVPVWMLLNRPADPRWTVGRHGDRTAWYPSMRIFQQDRPGDWGPVVARVAAALRREPPRTVN